MKNLCCAVADALDSRIYPLWRYEASPESAFARMHYAIVTAFKIVSKRRGTS